MRSALPQPLTPTQPYGLPPPRLCACEKNSLFLLIQGGSAALAIMSGWCFLTREQTGSSCPVAFSQSTPIRSRIIGQPSPDSPAIFCQCPGLNLLQQKDEGGNPAPAEPATPCRYGTLVCPSPDQQISPKAPRFQLFFFRRPQAIMCNPVPPINIDMARTAQREDGVFRGTNKSKIRLPINTANRPIWIS
jgi:hypothetical protein